MLHTQRVRSFQLSGINYKTSPLEGMVDIVSRWVAANACPETENLENRLITYVNPHVYNLSMEDDAIVTCLNKSDLTCIDGVGIKLAVLLMQRQNLPRVVAEHLFNALVEKLEKPVSVVLIGVEADEVSAAAVALTQQNSNLDIKDTCDGFAGMDVYKNFLRQHAAVQLVLIGAGSPKSEQIALLAMQQCSGSVVMHIGAGTIKTWAGTKRRGPALMSLIGCEWLHRLVFEPHTRTRYTHGAFIFAKNLMNKNSPTIDGKTEQEHS